MYISTSSHWVWLFLQWETQLKAQEWGEVFFPVALETTRPHSQLFIPDLQHSCDFCANDAKSFTRCKLDHMCSRGQSLGKADSSPPPLSLLRLGFTIWMAPLNYPSSLQGHFLSCVFCLLRESLTSLSQGDKGVSEWSDAAHEVVQLQLQENICLPSTLRA